MWDFETELSETDLFETEISDTELCETELYETEICETELRETELCETGPCETAIRETEQYETELCEILALQHPGWYSPSYQYITVEQIVGQVLPTSRQVAQIGMNLSEQPALVYYAKWGNVD